MTKILPPLNLLGVRHDRVCLLGLGRCSRRASPSASFLSCAGYPPSSSRAPRSGSATYPPPPPASKGARPTKSTTWFSWFQEKCSGWKAALLVALLPLRLALGGELPGLLPPWHVPSARLLCCCVPPAGTSPRIRRRWRRPPLLCLAGLIHVPQPASARLSRVPISSTAAAAAVAVRFGAAAVGRLRCWRHGSEQIARIEGAGACCAVAAAPVKIVVAVGEGLGDTGSLLEGL